MWRYLAGGLAALLLVAAGVLVFKTPARSDSPLPAAPAEIPGQADEALPDSMPEATAKTREEKRFNRYDKDRNAQISRAEYLALRVKAYARLDKDGDGKLSFEEWATKTTTKFAEADKDKSGAMTPAEFATTAPKRRAPTPRTPCPPAAPKPESDDG
jgi:hypothetical protein